MYIYVYMTVSGNSPNKRADTQALAYGKLTACTWLFGKNLTGTLTGNLIICIV